MATATVPKIVLTINHASGAGYYAMAGQGFDPDFIFTWPTGRMGVMEGESAVMALFSSELEKLERKGLEPDEKMKAEMERVRAKYESELGAPASRLREVSWTRYITPEDTRVALALALRTALNNPGPHLGVPVLPCNYAKRTGGCLNSASVRYRSKTNRRLDNLRYISLEEFK